MQSPSTLVLTSLSLFAFLLHFDTITFVCYGRFNIELYFLPYYYIFNVFYHIFTHSCMMILKKNRDSKDAIPIE
jgi:hypothetical protein